MKTREILSIVALSSLGLCLLCGLAKMAMKKPQAKQACNKACSLLLFVGLVLIGVSQLLEETTKSSAPGTNRPGLGQRCLTPQQFPGSGLRGNCQPGLECKRGAADLMPVCMKPSASVLPGVGQQCTGVGSCLPGLKCDMITDNKGVCVKPPPGVGQMCTGVGSCLPGLKCNMISDNKGVCVKPLTSFCSKQYYVTTNAGGDPPYPCRRQTAEDVTKCKNLVKGGKCHQRTADGMWCDMPDFSGNIYMTTKPNDCK